MPVGNVQGIGSHTCLLLKFWWISIRCHRAIPCQHDLSVSFQPFPKLCGWPIFGMTWFRAERLAPDSRAEGYEPPHEPQQRIKPRKSKCQDQIAALHIRRGIRGTDRVILQLGKRFSSSPEGLEFRRLLTRSRPSALTTIQLWLSVLNIRT